MRARVTKILTRSKIFLYKKIVARFDRVNTPGDKRPKENVFSHGTAERNTKNQISFLRRKQATD